jgi:hypothetical protein
MNHLVGEHKRLVVEVADKLAVDIRNLAAADYTRQHMTST